VEPRLDRPGWDAESRGDVVDRSILPVAQEHHDAVVEVEGGDCAVEVRIDTSLRLRRSRIEADRRRPNLDGSTASSELIATLVHDDPLEPDFEAVWVAKRPVPAPSREGRFLDGFLRLALVQQDRASESVRGVELGANQVPDIDAPLGHDRSLHARSLVVTPG
jgi:hypothetical protein